MDFAHYSTQITVSTLEEEEQTSPKYNINDFSTNKSIILHGKSIIHYTFFKYK